MDKNNYTMLVVEDNPGDFLLIEDYLQEHILEPELLHVSKFEEALKILNNPAQTIDIILLDLTLPDISKDNLITAIKDITHYHPVIILTGYTDLEFATKSLAVGVSDYLIKDTITPLVLYKSIRYSLERFRFLKSLFQSEKKYMDLFELSPLPLVVFDAETLAFLDVNRAAIRHYGYTKEEFLDKHLKDIRPEEDIPLMKEAVNKALSSQKELLNDALFRHKKKDGSIITVEVNNNVISYNNKKAIIAIVTDVTEKLSHIASINQQNTMLREIAWMQSHVVRAPLTRLMSLIEIFKDEHVSVKEKEDLLPKILLTANEIDEVIKNIVHKADHVIQKINE